MINEKILWIDQAGMEDFKVNPMHWLYALLTFGLYVVYVYIDRKFVNYTLTTERIIKDWGIFTRNRDEVELYRVKDVIFRATIFQRFVGTGDIEVTSSDVTRNLVIQNMKDAFNKREQIRMMAIKLRTKNGVRSILHE